MNKFLSNFEFSKRAPRDLVKNALVFVLLALFAYQVGIGLFKTFSVFSLGGMARNILPAMFVGILLVIILTLEDFGFLRTFLQKPEIGIRQVISIGLSALFIGITILYFGEERGLTEFIVILAVIIAFFSSLYFMLTGKGFYAVVTFLLALPFLNLVEYWLRYIPFIFEWGPVTLTPTIVFLLILIFISLISQRNKDSHLSMPTSLKWAILIFVLISTVSSIASINPLKSLKALFLEFTCPLMFFYIVLRNLQEEKQVNILTYSIVTSVVITSFNILYFFTRALGQRYSEITDLDSAFLEGNLHTGSWMNMVIMALPIAIALSVVSNNKKLKVIFWGSTAFLFVTIVLSFVRTAILSTFVLLTTLAIAKKLRRVVFIILIICTIGIIFYSPLLEKYIDYNFKDIVSFADILYTSSFEYRVNAWIAASEMIRDHPLLGIGSGLWEDYIPNYGMRQRVSGREGDFIWGYINEPHNYYIEIATYTGLLGFITWILILIIIFKNAIRCLVFAKEESRYYLVLGSIAGLFAYLTWCLLGGGFVDERSSNIGVGIYFFVLVAIIVKLSNFKKTKIIKFQKHP